MFMHMHKTIVWWTIWGLFVSIGIYGLKEGGQHSVNLIASIPILTGAAAAAVLRLKHEYHEVILHAKWVGVSTVFLLLGSAYLYVRAEGYGPFATGSSHKAFLGTTFEMSPHEVERALGRSLAGSRGEHAPEGLKDWAFMMLPGMDGKRDTRTLSPLTIYRVPAQARFDFVSGKLGRVEIQFQPTPSEDTTALVHHVQEDLEKEYRQQDSTASPENTSILYRKEAVDAALTQTSVDPRHQQVAIVLQYLPYVDKAAAPLAVEAKAF